MHLLKQSTAATVVVGPVLDSSGAAVTTAVVGDFRLAKEGSSAVLSGATVTHDANGYYLIALTTTNTNTVGRLAIYSNNTAQSMGTTRFMVLLASVYDALVTNATNANGGLPAATGNITALAGAISTLTAPQVRTELSTELGRIDATISSRSTLTAGGVRTELATELGRIDATISSRSTLTAGEVRTELATELARIDVTLSSRLASASYVAPDNATIGTISINLGTVNDNVLTRLAASAYTAPLSASQTRAALGLATANLDTQLADIPTVSEFEARTLTTANYATAANQTAIKAVTDKLNTGLVLDGAVYQFTANMLELAPGGGGGGSATLENQELILANLDNVTGAVAAAVARLQLETQITGFPATICRGSDYDTTLESEIRLQLLDLDNNPITEIGGTPVAEITWLFGLGTERQPRLVAGACSWDGTTDELVIQLAAADTNTTPLGSVVWQIGAQIGELTRWLGGGTTRIIERQFTA